MELTVDFVNKIKDTAFYVIANGDGQFYRRKGYGGYGATWVNKVDTARVYVKLDMARRQVTYFANAFPDYPPPVIIKLNVGTIELLDERERIAKAKRAFTTRSNIKSC